MAAFACEGRCGVFMTVSPRKIAKRFAYVRLFLYLCNLFREIYKMRRLSHAQYYQDRSSEYELCKDFPADEILIEGLHTMQSHFRANHVAIDIPVVRLMNAAHFIASYMFNTECSGDQLEYDVLAHESIGRDKQLVPLTIIVVAAMLKRTDGIRARQCRNLILDNRDPDFEEGVTLYDRFLQSSEKHFAEEDFLIDTHAQIMQLQEENEKLTAENLQLKYTISTMEKEKAQTVVYNYGTYNDIHDNPNSTIYTTTPSTPVSDVNPAPEEKPSAILPDFFRVSKQFPEDDIRKRLAAELSQSTTKIEYCRALYRLQHMGCINIDQYASDAKRAAVLNEYQSKYKLAPNDFCRARMNL